MVLNQIEHSLEVVTAPTSEPVTAAECKRAAKIDYTDEDAEIAAWIQTAREEVEHSANIALMTQTLRLNLDDFPCGDIFLPVYPVVSVSSVTYTDFGGSTQTWGSSYYVTDFTSFPPRVQPAYGQFYPVARCQPKSVKVNFVAGYTSAALVPEIAKQAIRLRVASYIRDRSGVGSDEYEKAFQSLIFKLQRFGIV